MIILIIVDFPAPFGPRNPANSPLLIEKLTEFNAFCFPNSLLMFLISIDISEFIQPLPTRPPTIRPRRSIILTPTRTPRPFCDPGSTPGSGGPKVTAGVGYLLSRGHETQLTLLTRPVYVQVQAGLGGSSSKIIYFNAKGTWIKIFRPYCFFIIDYIAKIIVP